MPLDQTAGARWLSVCNHRIRGFGAPYLLVVQHHIVPVETRIVAPVIPALGDRATLLAPRVVIGTKRYRALLLDMASAPLAQIGKSVAEAHVEEDAVTDALDAIFRGYPVGLPMA
jgi:hypothetical protein